KYQTAYACEGKKLTIECDPGDIINLIRANYGRFSITICNDHGNVEWSVNCMFPKSLTVLNSRCAHKQSCSVLAATSMFGDPCPGTHKYLEAHYQCISAAQTSTTTNRPSPPPWVLNNGPPIFGNGSGLIQPPAPPPRLPTLPGVVGIHGINAMQPTHATPSSSTAALPGGRLKGVTSTTTKHPGGRHDGLPPPPQLHHHHHHTEETTPTKPSSSGSSSNVTAPTNTRILTGVGGSGTDDGTLLTTKSSPNRTPGTAASATNGSLNLGAGGSGSVVRNINNINLNAAGMAGTDDESKLFCGPTHARNLFWNITRVGDVNVQPCPGGAAGIAKWRCVLMKRLPDAGYDEYDDDVPVVSSTTSLPPNAGVDCVQNSSNCDPPVSMAHKVNQNQRLRNFEPTWHPMTPDLTQCRSLWLNSLEMRVNQRDSSLISIANDLSEVTSSKTLYGGDMLVTTKIIQTMSEKMFHDKETFPDQRQREAIIMELLHGVVKTGSNLLDESQLSSWLDLNQEDQMRVATSLLTGLEYNAFLLADTIIRERNVVQKVKNILLSVRVLETKTIQGNVVFPDSDQWPLSSDRIELPRTALIENSEGGLVRIVFAAFDRLESILKPSYDHFDLKSARSYGELRVKLLVCIIIEMLHHFAVRNTAILSNDSDAAGGEMQQRIRILNSKVISASLGKGRHIQLSQPITLVLKHLKTENVSNPTCVFWNYIDHAWSANGCSLESTNRTHSVCSCNHLTNFAILMDVVDEHQHSLFTMFDGNMRIFIYISVAICVIFIIIALLTLKLFNGVFVKSARTSIYSSIYICLLAIELLFLLGIEQTETSIFCGFITVFLHCAILSGTAWFCYEGKLGSAGLHLLLAQPCNLCLSNLNHVAFHSYSTLTSDELLLEVDQTPKVNCYYLLSYGLSLSVVAISLVINPSTYTQNDYCVLMEANALFYATFVAPILLFFVAAISYTFLSWIIMRRKSRTALKTKEHTRLANVRFDIRCSFVFLLLLSAVWVCAYFYLRGAKLDEDVAGIYGYCFVCFNTLLGLYIFVFHCIQNEKIRREYRKYVRQHAWLPKCLRCSKTSISSGIVTGNGGPGIGGTAANSAGTLSKSKSKLPLGTNDEGRDDQEQQQQHELPATEDAIIMGANSDCELNEAQQRRTLKSGLLTGSLQPAPVGSVVLERGTLRSAGIASVGHASPTSSAGSTHLIFAHKQQQQQMQQQPGEAYYHQPDYYSWKQAPQSQREYYNNAGGTMGTGVGGGVGGASPQQAHEVFYWTQKHNNQHGKKKRGGGGAVPASPSGSLHSRATAASQVLLYPSYKKTSGMKQTPPGQQAYPHYAEALDPPNAAYYQQQLQQQQQLRQQRQQQQQQQQLSSDEEQAEQHAHLLHLQHQQRRAGGQQLPAPPPHMAQYQQELMAQQQRQQQQQQQQYRNKHSNCDLSQQNMGLGMTMGMGMGDAYYNQGGDGGPVYEEILSNRNSDAQHYEVGDFDVDEVYNNSVGTGVFNNMRAAVVAGGNRYGGGSLSGGSVSSRNKQQQHQHQQHLQQQQQKQPARRCAADDDDDDDDDEYDDEVTAADQLHDSVCDDEDNESDLDDDTHGLPPQSDERMRRLMALQDEDFKRRFQRQQRKNGMPIDYGASSQSAAAAHQEHNNAVFGVSGGVGEGSMRGAYRQQQQQQLNAKSPSARLAVNELFGHGNAGPPLPPANQQTPAQKRQQLQKLSPQSTTSSSSHTSHSNPQHAPPAHHLQSQHHPHHQQQPARHLSAMLDENNTVRCYLEPLAK
ncbi:hypothetical protein KR215_008228, partial [Drosophila sulfurigaster]